MNKLIRKIVGIFPKSLQNLYCKHESVMLYIFYGALTTVISFVTQIAADYAGAPTWLSTSISWICAVTFAFFVNKFFVFESKDRTARVMLREGTQFYAARLVSFFFEMGFLIVTVDFLNFDLKICKIVVQVMILILNYLFSKFVVFKKKGNM
jgi:putative flippase GtrA